METHPMTIAVSLLAVAGVWWVAVEAIPGLVVEHVRGKLFDIRHRLFMAAARGELSFEHRGYQKLRSQINAQLRFVHKTSIVHLILVVLAMRKHNDLLREVESGWKLALNSGTAEQATLLSELEEEVGRAMWFRVFWADWYMTLPLVALRALLKPVSKAASRVREDRFVEVVQAEAFAAADHDKLAPSM